MHEQWDLLKKIPKLFLPDTTLPIDGNPQYKRRNDIRFVMCRGTAMDNRFVVPYSPYLTRMFRAHVNLEVCALPHVIKYVHKYVYKGSDRARIRLSRADKEEPAHDEIEIYVDARYVCTPEAIHRVFGFKMQKKKRIRGAIAGSFAELRIRYLRIGRRAVGA